MENLISVFVEEAKELLEDLERALLKLETDRANQEGIAQVFRSMHSLKGTAGMFGFDAISNLTHGLETIYQSIRDGQCSLTPEVFGTTLHCLDHLRDLLSDATLKDPVISARHAKLIDNISALGHLVTEKKSSAGVDINRNAKTYYIFFKPDESILKKGNNPLFLVDDLLSLGEGLSLPFFTDMPELASQTPDVCYSAFEVVLSTEADEREVRDVFMFVGDDCELEIHHLSDGIFMTPAAKQQLTSRHSMKRRFGMDKIKSVLTGTISGSKSSAPERLKGASSIRVSSERLDELMNLVSELVTTQASLTLIAGSENSDAVKSIAENVEKITRRLRDNAFTMTLVPIENLTLRFQRLVRDLSEGLGKQVEFRAEGTDTEIDKSIIEKLSDPLLHLLRNALDHGIETMDVRTRNSKAPHGTIMFRAYYEGSSVIIEIKDDGAGINLEKVRRKAIARGLISADVPTGEKELIDLIFLPGFSTSDEVTDVSGRGVGMDVVRRNIADIRGEISVASVPGKGTTFTIKLPLTLSIIDGLLVKVGETDFIVPLFSVNKCYEVPTAMLEDTFNNWVTLDGERIPFFYLRDEFAIHHGRPQYSRLIKVAYNGNLVGIAVDKIVGNYQAVLKPLGHLYKHQYEFLGATILGDGNVALVIDSVKLIDKLAKSFRNRSEKQPEAFLNQVAG